MTTERWQRIKWLYHEMSGTPPERAAALVEACHGDAALQAEVQSLLDQPPDFSVPPPRKSRRISCRSHPPRCRPDRGSPTTPSSGAARGRRHGRRVSRDRRDA